MNQFISPQGKTKKGLNLWTSYQFRNKGCFFKSSNLEIVRKEMFWWEMYDKPHKMRLFKRV